MLSPDPGIGGGGGRGLLSPDPGMGGAASVWSKNQWGGAGPPGPSPGSATEYSQVDNLFIFAASRVSDAISISAQTR